MTILNQWLDELNQELQDISEDDRNDILESYEEQINELINLKVNEQNILSKLGSPKKVALEIRQSLPDEDTINKPIASNLIRLKDKSSLNDTFIKKVILIACIIILIPLSLFFFISSIRILIGSILLLPLSIGLMIAILGFGLVVLNMGIATLYIGYLAYKQINKN